MTTLVDAPTRVDGVQLIGEMVGSGYRTPPSLVRRGDGQVLQVTPLLYAVLEAADGRRDCAEIAEVVGERLGREVTESDIRTLVDSRLRPLGLILLADGSAPELKRSNPLLALKFRFAVTDPQTTHRLTDPFRFLFRPVISALVIIGFVAVVGWVFFERGLGASAYDAFQRPHLLLLVFVVSVLSGGFHEFGHAAAARYGGAEPGVMGAGLYLVWPAFYTDVTDSYRLGRAGRLRTDLGGLYFNAIVVVGTFVWWWATGWEALLLLVATQVLQMTQQLLPLLRFDGYHVLADLAGVPDLYHRIRPTLLDLLPHRWRSPENRELKPWSRAVITLWVLVTVPMMALMLWALLKVVPRIVGSAGAVVSADADAVGRAWDGGNSVDVAANVLQLLGVVLPMLGCALILSRLGARYFGGLTRWSQGSLRKRVVATLVSATTVTVLLWAWYPQPGTYRPIGPDDRGLVTELVGSEPDGLARASAGLVQDSGALPAGEAARSRLSGGQALSATYEEGAELPTEADPDLVMVLVPTEAPADGSGAEEPGSEPAAEETWVFPFDKPLPPEEGDNQAMAVNTTDGSVVYDVAFALVWADDGEDVLNVNEAHAYASCTDCVTVAVAFQVVLILDDAQVVVPQNLAVAANYDCLRCITAAIASQLVLSVETEPGEEQLLQLGAVWADLIHFAQDITSYSLDDITTMLEEFQAEIAAIMHAAPPVADTATASASPSADPSGTASPSAVPSASPGATTTPTPTPSPSPTDGGASTSPAPIPSPTPAPTSAPTPTPTAPSSPSATTSSGTSSSPSPSP